MGGKEFAALELLSFYPHVKFVDRKDVFIKIVESDFVISNCRDIIKEIEINPSKTPFRDFLTRWTSDEYIELLKDNIYSNKRLVEYALMWAVESGMHKTSASHIQNYLERCCREYGIPLNPEQDDWKNSVLRKEIKRMMKKPEELNLENISAAQF